MYRCENWTIKKAEHQKIDAFKLSGVKKTLESILDSRSIPKEITPEYSLEGRMLKLKLLILWPPDVKN